MNRFDHFIHSLSDHELAIFVKYRRDGFLAKSKEKIDTEIKNRKLTPEKLESYSYEKLRIKTEGKIKNCSRCGSDILFTETSYNELPFNEFSSLEVASNTIRCRLCGLNPGKEKPKNIIKKVGRIITNLRNKRVKKWNSM